MQEDAAPKPSVAPSDPFTSPLETSAGTPKPEPEATAGGAPGVLPAEASSPGADREGGAAGGEPASGSSPEQARAIAHMMVSIQRPMVRRRWPSAPLTPEEERGLVEQYTAALQLYGPDSLPPWAQAGLIVLGANLGILMARAHLDEAAPAGDDDLDAEPPHRRNGRVIDVDAIEP